MLHKKILISAVLILGTVFSSSYCFSQTKPDLPGFDFGIFDYQFSRADRESDPGNWMREAGRGIESSMLLWEEILTELNRDPSFNKRITEEFSEWTKGELEKRFSLWLMERFFGRAEFNSEVSRETALVDMEYTYLLSTDNENHKAEKYLEDWSNRVKNKMNEQISFYNTALEAMYPEILSLIDETRREKFKSQLDELAVNSAGILKMEFDNMLAREERYFTARHTGDTKSLRRQSEDKSAGFTGKKLIEEAKHLTAEGIKSLEKKIDTAEAEGGSLVLNGEEWLSQYREQFEKGLRIWEEAEERFLTKRTEWEHKAGSDYQNGEEAWNKALNNFENARAEWETEVRDLFKSAEEGFSASIAELEKNIYETGEELEKEASLRTASGAETAKAWTDIYNNSVETAALAQRNISYWLERLELETADENKGLILEEIENWKSIYNSYCGKAAEAKNSLIEELNAVMDSDALINILNKENARKDFFIDEYQLELLRLKKINEYWEKQAAIAEELVLYSQNPIAGRKTTGERIASWEKAKTDYEESARQYEKAVDELKIALNKTGYARTSLDETLDKVKDCEKSLENLNLEYDTITDLITKGNGLQIITELAAKKEEYQKTKSALNDFSVGSAMEEYTKAVIESNRMTKMTELAAIAQELIAGGESFGKSLKELYTSLEKLTVASSAEKTSGNIEDYGIQNDNPWYYLLENLLVAREKHEDSGLTEIYNDLVLEALDLALNSAESELENRKNSLRLLLCESPDEISERLNYLTIDEIYENLLHSSAEYYKKSMKIDLDAFDYLLNNSDTSKESKFISRFFDFEKNVALSVYRELSDFYIGIENNDNYEVIITKLTEKAEENEFMAYYLENEGFFNKGEGAGIKNIFLKEEYLENEHWKNTFFSIASVSSFSPGLLKAFTLENVKGINEFYKRLNYSKTAERIIDMETLRLGLEKEETEMRVSLIEEYLCLLEDFMSFLPEELDEEFNNIRAYLDTLNLEQEISNPLFYENALRSAETLETVYSKIISGDNYVNTKITDLITKYLSDLSTDWNEGMLDLKEETGLSILEEAQRKINTMRYYERNLYGEITSMENKYTFINSETASLEIEAKKTMSLINEKQTEHNVLLSEFNEKTKQLSEAGEYYDSLYNLTQTLFSSMEDNEFLFEIQNEIKMWAETPYLDDSKPKNDLKLYKGMAERTETALKLLSDIYKNGETERNYSSAGYDELYRAYSENLRDSIFISNTAGILTELIEKETKNFKIAYESHKETLRKITGQTSDIFFENSSPEVFNYLEITDRGIKLSYTDDFTLLQNENRDNLNNFFIKNTDFSNFEKAAAELNERMKNYGFTQKKYIDWGLARDYLLRRLYDKNSDHKFLEPLSSAAGNVLKNGNLKKLIDEKHYREDIFSEQQKAWKKLSADEREDLEFYTILTFFKGGHDSSENFMRASEYGEYLNMQEHINAQYKTFKFFVSRGFFNMARKRDEAKKTLNYLKPVLSEYSSKITSGYLGLTEGIPAFENTNLKYLEASDRLNQVLGIENGGESSISWNTIKNVLIRTAVLSLKEINDMEKIWNKYAGEETIFITIPDAINFISAANKDRTLDYQFRLEEKYINDEVQRRAVYDDYTEIFTLFTNGLCSEEEFYRASLDCFDNSTPSAKKHLKNMAGFFMTGLDQNEPISGRDTVLLKETSEYFSGLIERVYAAKYRAEINARNQEWNLRREELNRRFNRVLNSASEISRSGREEWEKSASVIMEEYRNWVNKFAEEYKRADRLWDAVYSSSLKNKEEWLMNVEETANRKASSVMQNLIGADAESLSRAFEIHSPISFTENYGVENAEKTIDRLLAETGIRSLEKILGSGSAFITGIPHHVRAGLGGNGLWNSGMISNEAAIIARGASEEIKIRETSKMAFTIKMIADECIKTMRANVEKANIDFKNNMDEMFIIEGQWNRSGNSYTKDVIVHSTFIDHIITEKASVAGYRNYTMPHFEFSMDINKVSSGNHDSLEIQNLIDTIYKETNDFYFMVFGGEEPGESSKSSGEFGVYIGDKPTVKKKPDVDKGRRGVFESLGSGEAGRLITEYQFWFAKESNGIAKMQMASWDKPIWDSRNSVFDAPSIRQAANTGLQIASVVIGTVGAIPTGGGSLLLATSAMNTMDDLLFGSLDAASGRVGWAEAGVSLGKTALINTVSSASGALFNGIGSGANAFLKTGLTNSAINLTANPMAQGFIKTAMTGLNGISTGAINGVISSINYSSGSGWNFSSDNFLQGLTDSAKGALVSMTGLGTTEILNPTLDGFTRDLFMNGSKLNSTLGGLAGQGMNYALNGDFTLNVFNLDLLDKSGKINSGLIEMRLGGGEMKMNIGTGGADVSTETLISSIKGIETLGANIGILFSDEDNIIRNASAMRTLYSGSSMEKDEYKNYISGRTKISYGSTEYTESVYDPDTGIKTVYLGKNAMDDKSRYGLNVFLSHEAYRDGITGTASEQNAETAAAVIGHSSTALAIMDTYGLESLSSGITSEAEKIFLAANGESDPALISLLSGYDSSADYWKLISRSDGTHGISYDKNKFLTIEYVDENGIVSMSVPENQEFMDSLGWAASLAALVGPERVETLLGRDLNNADNYNFQTLKDVLGLPDHEIISIQKGGILPEGLTENQMMSLAGEALLKNSGASWNGKQWTNTGGLNLTLVDRNLASYGYILGVSDKVDGFDYSTIKAVIKRDTESYKGWSAYSDGLYNPQKQGLDSINYYQYDLKGSLASSITYTDLHTVDNMTTDSLGKNRDQPFNHPAYGQVQGNTVAPGDFNMGFYSTSNYHGVLGEVENAVLVINNAKTISGKFINDTGNVKGEEHTGRWLFHSNRALGAKKDYNSAYSDGCFVSHSEKMDSMLDYLSSIGLSAGYQIRTSLHEVNKNDPSAGYNGGKRVFTRETERMKIIPYSYSVF